MGYFDDLNNPDWGEGTAAARVVLSYTPTPYRALANYNAQVRAGQRNPMDDIVPVWQREPAAEQAEQAAPVVEQQTGGGSRTSSRTGRQVRGRVRPRVDYAAKFSGMNFTDAEKEYMTKAGFDPTNAKSVQEFILSKAANANLGARGGVGIADGYWGNKSAAAFQALRNQGIFTPKVDALESVKPVNEVPVDAPDFGYATNLDYTSGRLFKNLGFNNYQGLLRYAQTSQDQFAKDLRQRFGNRLTDQAYVESQLGISGKYRGGNAGDFGDIARSMQAWKTGINNDFDKRRADYAQKRLEERTGSNGIVYSSPEIMRKFESVKPSTMYTPPYKFDLSNFKFSTGFGGANTLGNQFGLTNQKGFNGMPDASLADGTV